MGCWELLDLLLLDLLLFYLFVCFVVDDFMGLDNVAVYTTLVEVKEGYWVVGSC